MTVWAVHPVKENLDSARQYGDIRFINGRYVHADELQNGQLPSGFLDNMCSAARDFDERDYLLIVGDHLQLIQFTWILAEIMDDIKVLRYDRQAEGYYPVGIYGVKP